MKDIHNTIKIGNQSRSSSLIISIYDIWNGGSWPKTKDLGRFGSKIAMSSISMQLDTQNQFNMLIINILIGIDLLDQKLQICKIWSQKWKVLQFLWNLSFRANRTC